MSEAGDATTARPLRRDVLVLVVLGVVLIGTGLGLREPWPPDEPRFALIAQEMVVSGRWLVPFRAGELYPDKPPLFLWLLAGVYRVTGSIRIATLLPSLLAGLVTLLCTYDLGRRLWNRRTGLWAGIALLATVQFVLQARSGQIDAVLCMFTTLGLYGLLRHALLGPSWGWYLGGSAAIGLGIITKGVGFLPLLVFVPLLWAHARRWRHVGPAPDRRWWWGPIVSLLAIGVWLVPLLAHVALRGDPLLTAYRDEILWRQTVTRYASSWGHLEPPWYYLVSVVPWLWAPLTLVLPWLLSGWRGALGRRDGRQLVLLGWIVLVVLFFSLSPGKRGVYVLPATPALALAAAPLLDDLVRRRGPNRVGFAATCILGAVAVGGAAVLVHAPETLAARQGAVATPLVGPLSLLAAVAFGAALLARPRRGLAALAAVLAVAWVVMGVWVYPAIDEQRSGRALMAAVEDRLGARHQLALVDWREQMVLQARRPVVHFGFHEEREVEVREAAAWLAGGEDRKLLVAEVDLAPCFRASATSTLLVAHRRTWHLVDSTALTGVCAGDLDGAIRYVPPAVRRAEG